MTDVTNILISVNIGLLAAVIYTLRLVVALDKKVDILLGNKGLKFDK